MDSLASHSEGDLQSRLTKQELRHRHPFTADEVTPDDGEKDVNKSKKPHGVHNRKSSNASDDSSHGFLPGLMKKIGFGSQEFKEKDVHVSEAHPSGMRRSSSHGFLKKVGFGSQEFKEKDVEAHSSSGIRRSGSHGFLKKIGFGSQEFKNHVGDGDHYHHLHHHRHGTRDKEIFGSEDADENYREHDDLFGSSDMTYQPNIEKANSLFGFEDTEFERGEKGRELFGSDDPDTLSFREKMNIVGLVDADADELERTRHVFGDENAEDSSDDEEDVKKSETKVHNGHSVSN